MDDTLFPRRCHSRQAPIRSPLFVIQVSFCLFVCLVDLAPSFAPEILDRVQTGRGDRPRDYGGVHVATPTPTECSRVLLPACGVVHCRLETGHPCLLAVRSRGGDTVVVSSFLSTLWERRGAHVLCFVF